MRQLYTCPICGAKYMHRSSLTRHLKKVHGKTLPPTQCPFCGKTFETHGGLGWHILVCHLDKEFQRKMGKRTVLKRWKQLPKISELQLQVILGSILGDGNLSKPHKTANVRFQERHCLKQASYVTWKYSLLKTLLTSPPKIVTKKRNGKTFYYIRIVSKCHPELTKLYKLIYRNGRKTISWKWLEMINHPIAIAIWYMDDGTYWKGEIILHTENLTKEEMEILKSWLKKKWNIESKIMKTKRGYQLKIKSKKRFTEIIAPYIIQSMKHKLPEKYLSMT